MRRLLGYSLIALLALAGACDTSKIPGLWKTYQHPTYRFKVRVPRGWETKSDGLSGADVVFLASEEDKLFRASVNVIAQTRKKSLTVKQVVAQSTKQLEFLFNEYRVLSEAPTALGDLEAYELRGRYRAAEGLRIIRTIVGITQDMQYTVTFSCRLPREEAFQRKFDRIRKSFQIERNLRDG